MNTRRSSTHILCDRYRIEGTLVSSSQSKVCSVVDDKGNKHAAKLVKVDDNENGSGSFAQELEVFKTLTKGKISFGHRSNGLTPDGFPNVYFVGRHGKEYNVIVMDILDPDLYRLCQEKTLSVRAYLHLACEMLNCLKELHRQGFVHRDVKPQNFMFNKRGKVHLIDFALSKRYLDPRTMTHLPKQEERYFSGTLIYGSINAQKMYTQSRRDDLESLGYSLIEMIKKRLPWDEDQDLSLRSAMERLAHIKENTTLKNLCEGLPQGIYDYMITVTSMSYSETPDYRSLREMLMSA